MPNTKETIEFFKSRLRQPGPPVSTGYVPVLFRVNRQVLTFPVRYDGDGCRYFRVKRPPEGKLSVLRLLPHADGSVTMVEYDQGTLFANIEQLNLTGRVIAVDFHGDVIMAGKQIM